MSQEAWQVARAVAEQQDWLITTAQARECRLTPGELAAAVRRRELRRLYPGVYLFDPDLVQQPTARMIHRAALLSEGGDACLYGASSVLAWGVQGLPSVDRVEVAIVGGTSRRARSPGAGLAFGDDLPPVVVRQVPVLPAEVRLLDGLRVRDVGLSVVDAALDLDRPTALSVLDSALHLELITVEELHCLIAAAKGRPGIQRIRPLVDVADARAESPLESRIRLICIDGHLAPDELQHRVYDSSGLLVAVGDLGWVLGRRRPLLAEADGKVHALPAAVFRDRRRGNLLVPAEYDTVRFVWADSMRPSYVLYVVRSALAVA